jgi:hypothetical protein
MRDDKIEQLPQLYQNIRRSISYDYRVLKAIIKDPEEYKKIENQYVGDTWFLNSVKGMYYEYPELFEDEKIQENLSNTIKKNESFITSSRIFYMGNEKIKEKILKR